MADTIAAISTAAVPAGIGVIRVSGERACAVADAVFCAASGAKLADMPGYRAAFGHIYDGDTLIDEAVATRFCAPRSYTGEDVVELSCHGGAYILRRTLRALLSAGARMAEPGEFTRRAFLNGKLDLTAAEAVPELIGAAGEQALGAAVSARSGAVFEAADGIKKLLLGAASSLAAWVDFPDEEVPEITCAELISILSDAREQLARLTNTADCGRMLHEGVSTVIAGRPNVGKSSIMNLLSRCGRSIVTDIAGTTRDVIEDSVCVDGIMLRLSDTAGLRDTDDPVESAGVRLASGLIESSAMIIAVFDGSQPLTADDRTLLARLNGKKYIAVVNKSDLPQAFSPDELQLDGTVIAISAMNDAPDALEIAISSVLGADRFDPSAGIIANERQLGCVMRAASAVDDALNAARAGVTLDAVGVCIDDALAALCELTGEHVSESVIDEVFSRFCVGK